MAIRAIDGPDRPLDIHAAKTILRPIGHDDLMLPPSVNPTITVVEKLAGPFGIAPGDLLNS